MEEIDIKELLTFIKEKIWIVGIVLLCSIIATVIYVKKIKQPIYKSSTTYVLISDSENDGITTSEVTLNEKLIATYTEIIKSRNIMEKVIGNLGLEDETAKTLATHIKVEQISTSSMIRITVSYKDPEIAQKIAYRIGREFSKEIQNLYKMNNISIIDEPLVDTNPSNSSNTKIIAVINGGGIIASLMIIFLIFYFDNTIKTTEQVEDKIKLPVLGNIPLISKKNEKGKDLIVHNNPKLPISEGIRTIRTNLQFSSMGKDIKKIMVTSSMPSEGKSFTSANLAIAFAQDGHKVLIIDCDMRKGRLHKIFKTSNSKGLSNVLIDDIEKNYKKYIKETRIENLSILPSGMVPPNPSELLNSDANKQLIEVLEKEYDYIIFDCVPLNGLPDSLIMSSLVNKVIVVCASKQTPIDLLKKTTSSLQNVEADIAGVVINKTKEAYDKYYGHYYGN